MSTTIYTDDYLARINDITPLMRLVAWRILHNETDCADAIQEALFKGWLHFEQLKEKDYFQTWQIRILINECYNLQRRGQRICCLEDDYLSSIAKTNNPYWVVEYREMINTISQNKRVCLEFYYLQGYSVAEIANQLGITKSAVKLRLYYGRKQLRQYLQC